ncbi:MAG: Na+:solute symporter [Acidobacteria bacterium]|nr:Na+:solute symporter [Acidobacteriota bacterium]
MATADWVVIALYCLLMVAIGLWSYRKVADTQDFYVAGGKMPWWLIGISHHMSGYSAAVFVAHAGVAYSYGFTLYLWWALPIAIGVFVGALCIAPRWARLRVSLNIVSPTEYLSLRYNVPTQQLMAWSGVILKLFDVGAKWASIGAILSAFTGISLLTGILLSGCLSLSYIALGGLWADVLTDMAQFVVQLLAGLALLFIVLIKLGGAGAVITMWDRLPPEHSAFFNGPYTAGFCLAYVLIAFLSANGGTWNLAQRYIAAPSGPDARRAAILSAVLYLVWPLFLFLPMWAAPLFLPNLADPSQSYALMAKTLLPPGLVGLILASMFAHTMAMTTSDANAVSAVVTRDILPVLIKKLRERSTAESLKLARLSTVIFTMLTLVVAVEADRFGGILDLLFVWFGGLVGPTAIPMILGLLPVFRRSNATAAIVSWAMGVGCFVLMRQVLQSGLTQTMAYPVLVSSIVFIISGWVSRAEKAPPKVATLFQSLEEDPEPSVQVNSGKSINAI